MAFIQVLGAFGTTVALELEKTALYVIQTALADTVIVSFPT
jgi:hypothetical protein